MEKYSLQSDTPISHILFCDFSAGRSGQNAGNFLKHTAVRRKLEKIAGKIIKVLFFREF